MLNSVVDQATRRQTHTNEGIRSQQFNILFLIQCNIKNQCGWAALFTNTAEKTQHVIHRDTELTLFNSAL